MLRFSKILATSVVAAATLVTGAAMANPVNVVGRDTPVRVVVTYGDLNLGTDEGVRTLRQRLNWAVRYVEGWTDKRDLKAQAVCQRDHRHAMQMADAIVAAQRNNLAFAGPTVLDLG
ncbi:MAG: UrcA family protein [Caulobacteraceae bacterium]|nr:UrcA family protein [Caulobacteraceae bacterium]